MYVFPTCNDVTLSTFLLISLGMYQIFASVWNSGPNSVFVFRRIEYE